LFKEPSRIIEKYLKKYLPGENTDGVVFINSKQPEFFKEYCRARNDGMDVEKFYNERCAIIPNTSEINWDWKSCDWNSDEIIAPPQEQYNESFFRDIGLQDILVKNGLSMENAVFLLQHTRIVPRKRIDKAIDLAFMLAKRFKKEGTKKFIVLLVSGHSGDEQAAYKEYLQACYYEKCEENSDLKVIMLLGEERIFSCKDIVVDKKYYSFEDIPSIIASKGGLGTYFSEIEGFGNNLLEMVSYGLPAIINRYDIFKSDIEKYGFIFPAVDDCEITEEALDACYRLLTDNKYRNECARHNLKVLEENLSHMLVARKLERLLNEMAVFASV
jgi:glycosyltransferase involved in cell wall biosynthesis